MSWSHIGFRTASLFIACRGLSTGGLLSLPEEGAHHGNDGHKIGKGKRPEHNGPEEAWGGRIEYTLVSSLVTKKNTKHFRICSPDLGYVIRAPIVKFDEPERGEGIDLKLRMKVNTPGLKDRRPRGRPAGRTAGNASEIEVQQSDHPSRPDTAGEPKMKQTEEAAQTDSQSDGPTRETEQCARGSKGGVSCNYLEQRVRLYECACYLNRNTSACQVLPRSTFITLCNLLCLRTQTLLSDNDISNLRPPCLLAPNGVLPSRLIIIRPPTRPNIHLVQFHPLGLLPDLIPNNKQHKHGE